MKTLALLISHLNSGSNAFCQLINKNPRVQLEREDRIYNHPLVAKALTEKRHKLDSSAAVFIDEILFNQSFHCKSLYNTCKFIYVIREPLQTINGIIKEKTYDPLIAVRYYCYRLRRICEMARMTPGAVLMNWDEMTTGESYGIIEDYLNLRDPILKMPELFDNFKVKDNSVDKKLMDSAERAFEYYFYYLKNQNLRK